MLWCQQSIQIKSLMSFTKFKINNTFLIVFVCYYYFCPILNAFIIIMHWKITVLLKMLLILMLMLMLMMLLLILLLLLIIFFVTKRIPYFFELILNLESWIFYVSYQVNVFKKGNILSLLINYLTISLPSHLM